MVVQAYLRCLYDVRLLGIFSIFQDLSLGSEFSKKLFHVILVELSVREICDLQVRCFQVLFSFFYLYVRRVQGKNAGSSFEVTQEYLCN